MHTITPFNISSPPAVPTVLPDLGYKYEVLEVIGHGGMGIVLKTRHRTLSQIRAVKLLQTDPSTIRPSVPARFRQEAMIASDLSHPNIVRVFDFDTAPNGAPFIVMEYLEGESVEHLLQREQRIPLERTVEILADVAAALDAVHQTGVVHRDLKPANLFITHEGSVKILDFGISHIEHAPSRITQEGEVVGTLLYMAPEQLQKCPSTPRADIFSLGAAALEMLTGRSIVETNDIRMLSVRMIDEVPFVTHAELSCLPAHAADALVRALSKNPLQRFASASDFVRALRGDKACDETRAETEQDRSFAGFEEYAAVVLDRESEAASEALRRAHVREWIVLVLLMFIIAALVSLFHPDVRACLFGNPEAVNFLIMPGPVNTDTKANKWVASVLPKLIAEYMNVDPRASATVFDVAAAEVPSEEYSRITYELTGRAGNYSLHLSAENVPEKRAPRRFTAQGSSIETVVESATAHLAADVLAERLPSNVEIFCEHSSEEICVAEHIAENALVQGLFPRVERAAAGPLAADKDAFAPYIYRFIQCGDAPFPERCRTELILPSSDSAPRRDLLSAAAKDKSLSHHADILCRLSKSEDPLVRAAAQSIDFAPCGMTAPICGRMDTLYDRLACLRASERVDSPDISRRYFEEAVETDMCHFLVLGSFSSLYKAPYEAADTDRFYRMVSRFGDREKDIALSAFRYHMNVRDGSEALIWARRCTVPGYLEGLALMSDGWLKAGISMAVANLAETFSPEPTNEQVDRLHAVLQSILITGSADAANAWMNAVKRVQRSAPLLDAAGRLVRAVIEEDIALCRADDAVPGFELERRYLCGDLDELLRDFGGRAGAQKGTRDRAREFYIGDALLNAGRLEAAATVFKLLESDPFIRSAYPVASIEAAARLGKIAEERGELDEASSRYRAYLKVWPGLDVPLDTHLSVEKSLARIKRKLDR